MCKSYYSDYKNTLAFIDEYCKSKKGNVFFESGIGSVITFEACTITAIAKEVINDVEFPEEISRHFPQRIKMTLEIDLYGQ